MKKCFLFLVLSIISVNIANAFPDTVNLDSKSGQIIYSDTTKLGKTYFITVSGTYSMWPTYTNYGVDGAYLYDVPQEEIDALRWPPQKINILGLEHTFYQLPMWLGEDNSFPPADIDIPGLNVRIASREYLGLRVNGKWLENTGFNEATHTYKFQIKGNGLPISLQILDSSYSISQQRVVPKYEDNSGMLNVIIEEEADITICDLKVLCDKENGTYGIQLSASIFEYYDEMGKPVNKLKDLPREKLGIALGGNFICPDSINCQYDKNQGISWCFVFDKSGSMNDIFDVSNNKTKLDILKEATNNFINRFQQNDEAMLITYNHSVSIEQDWTDDKVLLQSKINNITAVGATSTYDGGYLGVDKTYQRNNPNKVLILLSDGEDNQSSKTQMDVINYAILKQVPIYTIGVSLDPKTTDTLKRIARLTGGKYYQAEDPDALQEVLDSIENEVSFDDCCQIYFTFPQEIQSAEKPLTTTITLLYFDESDSLKTKDMIITILDTCYIPSGIVEKAIKSDDFVKIYPIPASNLLNIDISGNLYGDVKIQIINLRGEVVYQNNYIKSDPNITTSINTSGFISGNYYVKIILNEYLISEKFIIIK